MAMRAVALTREELGALQRRPGWFWTGVAAVWLALVAAVVALWFVTGLDGGIRIAGWLGCFLLIGWLQYVLVQAMHEALHQKMGADGSGALPALATAWPVGLTRAYRAVHFAHHRYPGDSEKDPDFVMYGRFPESRGELLKMIAFYFCGVPAVVQVV